MKHVFVISGKKGVGKDTIGKIIKELFKCANCRGRGLYDSNMKYGDMPCLQCNNGFLAKTFSFATPFKNFCVDVLGIPHEWCFGDSAARSNEIDINWNDIEPELRLNRTGKLTVRDALILIGQHMRRMYPDIWANAARVEARKFFSSNKENRTFILCDTRQPNEIDIFKKAPEVERGEWKVTTIRVWRRVPLDANSNDYTETALDHMDFLPTQQDKLMKYLPEFLEVLDENTYALRKDIKNIDKCNYYLDNNIDMDSLKNSIRTILIDVGAI